MRRSKIVNPLQIHTTYKTADGKKVPSVTTYLDILAKPAIIHWAWEQGVAGLDYRKVRDQAGDTGSLVHYLILSFLKGLDPDLSSYSQNDVASTVVPMEKFYAWLKTRVPLNSAEAFFDWQKSGSFQPTLLEEPLVSERYRFGGTPDFYGKDNGKLTLLDFKTSGAVYLENFCQLAAYKKLLEEYGYKVESARIVRVSKVVDEAFDDRPAGNLENHWKIFLACQAIYELQKETRRQKEAK